MCWHHCLFLDLQADKVSLPGGANNTWLSCWAHSGEIANYFSLTGEWLLSAAFWCRIGAAGYELAYQSLSEKRNLDCRPASFLGLRRNYVPFYLRVWLQHWGLGRWTLKLELCSKGQKNNTQDWYNVRFCAILVWDEIPNHISVSSNLERLLPVEAISQDTKLVFISGLVGRMPRGASSTQLWTLSVDEV